MSPMSGELAFIGENVVRSAEIALSDLGRNKDIELVAVDAGGLEDQSQTVLAFKKLTEVDGVQYIINEMSSNATMAIAPLIDSHKVLMIIPGTGGEDVDNAAKFLFRNGPSDIKAGTEPADDIYNKFGYKKVTLLTDNAEYALDVAKHFKQTFKGEIVVDQIITPDKTDYRTELLKVKNSSSQAIFIITGTGVSSSYLIKQSKDMGLNVPIFANFLAYGPTLFKIAGDAAEGVYIYNPAFNESSPAVQAFFKEYQDKYGSLPALEFHSTGTYDDIKMGLEAIDSVGNNGEKIRSYLLEKIQNWQGLNGIVSFDKYGHTGTGFILMQIKNGKLIRPTDERSIN